MLWFFAILAVIIVLFVTAYKHEIYSENGSNKSIITEKFKDANVDVELGTSSSETNLRHRPQETTHIKQRTKQLVL